MATVRRLHAPEAAEPEGVLDRLVRLLKLELELGLTETREVVRSLVLAIAVAIPAAVALIASIPVLIAGALAPLFDAPWAHLVTGGGAVLLLALAALAWSAMRVKRIRWPAETKASIQETWRWLEAQLKSRLTSR
jgi:hypothetical protein